MRYADPRYVARCLHLNERCMILESLWSIRKVYTNYFYASFSASPTEFPIPIPASRIPHPTSHRLLRFLRPLRPAIHIPSPAT